MPRLFRPRSKRLRVDSGSIWARLTLPQGLRTRSAEQLAGWHAVVRWTTSMPRPAWAWLQQAWLQEAQLARPARPRRQLADVVMAADHRVERVRILGSERVVGRVHE